MSQLQVHVIRGSHGWRCQWFDEESNRLALFFGTERECLEKSKEAPDEDWFIDVETGKPANFVPVDLGF